MDNIINGAGKLIKTIMKCPLTRYHLAGLFLLMIVQRNSEVEPSEYAKEIYYKLRFAPTPTKLLTWPVRMSLCFLLALPSMSNFPLRLIVGEQYIFPYLFVMETMSCLMLGLHVTNYCSRNASKCFYSNNGAIVEEVGDFRSDVIDGLIQVFVTTHLIYSMWLVKSAMHILQLVVLEIYQWVVRHVVPKVIPACRVIVLMFALNLQDAVIPVSCIYVCCKLFMDLWLMPLMERPLDFPNKENGTNNTNARLNEHDDGNSSELSDEFEDINEPIDEAVAA